MLPDAFEETAATLKQTDVPSPTEKLTDCGVTVIGKDSAAFFSTSLCPCLTFCEGDVLQVCLTTYEIEDIQFDGQIVVGHPATLYDWALHTLMRCGMYFTPVRVRIKKTW